MASKPSNLRQPSKLLKPSAGIPRPTAELSRSNSPNTSGILTANTDDFIVGNRVWVGGTKPGMIQYIGETQFAPGEWAGVVLDEPIGKNDGSVGGVKYFQCEPKRGVFSRLTKLTMEPIPGLGSMDDVSSVKANGSIHSSSPRPSTPLWNTRCSTPSSQKGNEIWNLRLGDRVQVTTASGVKTGNLRHLGTTEFASGEWAGVELDEATGKNDGSVSGKRYFECPMKYGLFAPVSKVSKLGATPSIHRTTASSAAKRIGGSPKRAGSQESISTIGSTSSASRITKPRLGINSLNAPAKPSRTSAASVTATHTAMQGALKEKEQHIEQLLRERDLERSEVARAASQVEDAERELANVKAEFQRYRDENNQSVVQLKEILEQAEKQKQDFEFQLEEERKKIEDLQFRVEEESILKSDLESMKEADEQRIRELEQLYATEKSRVELLEQDSNVNFQNEELIAKQLDEIESLQRKLAEQELTVTSVLTNKAKGDDLSSRLTDELVKKEARIVELEATVKALEIREAENQNQNKKLEDMLAESRKGLDGQERIVEELKAKLMASDERCSEIQQQISTLEIASADLKRKLQGAEDRSTQLAQQKSKLEFDIAEQMKSSGDNSSQLSQMNDKLRESEKLIENLQLNVQTSVHEKQKLEDILEHLKIQQQNDVENLKENHKKECENFSEKLNNAKSEAEALRNGSSSVAKELETKSQELLSREAELVDLRAKMEDGEKRSSDLAAQLAEALKKVEELAKNIEGVHSATGLKLEETKNEINVLQKERHEAISKYEASEAEKSKLEKQVENLHREKQSQAAEVTERDRKLQMLNGEVDRLKAEFNDYRTELQRKLVENELDQNTFNNMRNMAESQQKTIEELQQLLKKSEEEKDVLGKGSEQLKIVLEQKSELESKISSYESKFEEAKSMQMQMLTDFETEKETLQKMLESSQMLLDQKSLETERSQGEVLKLKKDLEAATAFKTQTEQLQQENSQLKREKSTLENHVKLLDNQLKQSTNNGSSLDPTLQKLLDDKEAADGQIDFLNSVIVDMQKKNDDLQSRIQILEVGEFNESSSDVNLNDIKTPRVAPRLFCDICDVFDLHDTEDCPQQESCDDPPPSKNHGARRQERPYCETCEVFGHWTNECDDNETF